MVSLLPPTVSNPNPNPDDWLENCSFVSRLGMILMIVRWEVLGFDRYRQTEKADA